MLFSVACFILLSVLVESIHASDTRRIVCKLTQHHQSQKKSKIGFVVQASELVVKLVIILTGMLPHYPARSQLRAFSRKSAPARIRTRVLHTRFAPPTTLISWPEPGARASDRPRSNLFSSILLRSCEPFLLERYRLPSTRLSCMLNWPYHLQIPIFAGESVPSKCTRSKCGYPSPATALASFSGVGYVSFPR